jgi:prepilin-type N-terminal cleavage/methylation domain-containing protein
MTRVRGILYRAAATGTLRSFSRGRAFTLVELLATMAVLSLLLQLLLPAVQSSRESARTATCQNQLRMIGLASQMYTDAAGALPAGSKLSGYVGRQDWNWGYARYLLPMVEEGHRLTHIQGSDSRPCVTILLALQNAGLPHPNLSPVTGFNCPSDSHAGQQLIRPRSGVHYPASYLGVSGTSLPNSDNRHLTGEGLLFSESRIALRQIRDGISKTLLVGERAVPDTLSLGWLICGGAYYEQYLSTFRGVSYAGSPIHEPGPNSVPAYIYFSGFHRHGVNFALADGSARLVSYDTDHRLLNAMATRDRGE